MARVVNYKVIKNRKKGGPQMVDEKKIKALREKAGLTGEELGFAVGISQSLVAHIERGFKQPNIEVLARIAEKFGVTVDELLKKQ